mmetsp:Transcript_130102/g.277961  ORF Transcript_130102/g.277961 Transcript_130102/m.277961 type:complete len:260 (+) Transcript_130102:179-958(+)
MAISMAPHFRSSLRIAEALSRMPLTATIRSPLRTSFVGFSLFHSSKAPLSTARTTTASEIKSRSRPSCAVPARFTAMCISSGMPSELTVFAPSSTTGSLTSPCVMCRIGWARQSGQSIPHLIVGSMHSAWKRCPHCSRLMEGTGTSLTPSPSSTSSSKQIGQHRALSAGVHSAEVIRGNSRSIVAMDISWRGGPWLLVLEAVLDRTNRRTATWTAPHAIGHARMKPPRMAMPRKRLPAGSSIKACGDKERNAETRNALT